MPHAPYMRWTPARCAVLKQMAQGCYTAHEIAEKLGCSAEAVRRKSYLLECPIRQKEWMPRRHADLHPISSVDYRVTRMMELAGKLRFA